MKTTLKATLALAIISPQLYTTALAVDKSIYGEDNRIDLFDASAETRRLADSVVSFWQSDQVLYDPAAKTVSLKTENLGDSLSLCPDERFSEQPTGAFCSGSLVGDDMIMTAGHCITNQAECNDARIIFGFAIKKPGADAPTRIGRKDVYACKKIISRYLGGEPGFLVPKAIGPDYALIQLDRKVAGHSPLAINRGRTLKNGDKLMVIGYPVGLPLKVAAGATVRGISPRGYFVADLDTFGGNSGSPVFNTATGLIEGILVRGDADFRFSLAIPTGCTTVSVNSQNGGRGEDVTKVSVLESFIPELAAGNKSTEMSFQDVRKPIGTMAEQNNLSRYFEAGFQ